MDYKTIMKGDFDKKDDICSNDTTKLTKELRSSNFTLKDDHSNNANN